MIIMIDVLIFLLITFSYWYIFSKRYSVLKDGKNYYNPDFNPGHACIFSFISVTSAYGAVCFFMGVPQFFGSIGYTIIWLIVACIAYFVMRVFVKICCGR